MSASLPVITAGFLPLTDALMLIAAHEKGFAAAEGFRLQLVRETSWANIRDRLGVGHFDVAHMLAPLAIAGNLGLNPLPTRVIAPIVLGHGGNAVTVSLDMWRRMQIAGAPVGVAAGPAGKALARVLAALGRRPRFGVVHINSSHNYELRYWLAASGIAPDRDVEIVVLPPPLLPDALAAGDVDGYCVGEPWSSVGVELGAGRIVTTKSSIWAASPDKVLGVRERWADENPALLAALVRAVVRAAEWCGEPEHRDEAAALIADPAYLGVPAPVVARALSGELVLGGGAVAAVERFYVPFADAATFPAPAHALWFYSQMVRWGEVRHTAENARIARETVRPDLYRTILADMAVPEGDGAAGQFFDHRSFDPAALDAYLTALRPL